MRVYQSGRVSARQLCLISMAGAHSHGARFVLLCCSDQNQETAMACRVAAMPTFKVFRDRVEVGMIRGADPDGLRSLVQQHAGDKWSVAGEGQTLGGGGGGGGGSSSQSTSPGLVSAIASGSGGSGIAAAAAISDQQDAVQAYADEATAFKRDYEENTRTSIEQGEVAAAPTPTKGQQRAMAQMQGYEGEPCPECQNFTLVRNGTCMKCDSCGSTTGCS